MPPPEENPTTWRLSFPVGTLDERVTMRGELARLRADPGFTGIEREADPSALGRNHPEEIHQVFFRWEPEDQALLRIRDQRRVPEPPLHDLWLRDHPEVQTPREVPPEVRQSIISEYIGSTEGRSRLAQSMVAPLRARMDYQSIGRRTFLVEQLPEGALPVYDRDPEVGAMVTAHIGHDANGSPVVSHPFELPAWVQPGVWVWFKENHDRIAQIKQIVENNPPEDRAPHFIRIHNWRRHPEEDVVLGEAFVRFWEECQAPKEPTPRFERILDDDFLKDLAPQTVTILIDGKESFITKVRRKITAIFERGLPAIYDLGIDKVERTPPQTNRFDRIDDD